MRCHANARLTWVLDDDGRVQRTRHELGLWFVTRSAVRAGCLYRPSGRYADLAGDHLCRCS